MKALLVRDLMTVGVPTCKRDSSVVEVARFLLEHDVEALCVLDEEGQGIGIIGWHELVGAYGKGNFESRLAEDVMTEGVPELHADVPLAAAAQMMQDKGVRIAYMLHNAAGITYPAAYISYRHLLRHMVATDDQELRDLGAGADRKTPIAQFIERRDQARKRNLGQ